MKKIAFILLIPVLLSACSKGKIRSDAYGNFEAKEIMISAENPGKLIMLKIEEGEVLEAHDTVAIIDTIQLHLKKEQLNAQKKAVGSRIPSILAQIEVQNQQKKNLLTEKSRVTKLLKDGAATPKQLDDINGSLNVIESQILSIKTQNQSVFSELDAFANQVDQIEDQIHKCIIINPVKGTVLEKYAEPWEVVVPGKVIYKIADLSELELKVFISGDQLPQVKTGQKVDVLIDQDRTQNTKLEGIVSWISQAAEFTPKIIQTKKERVKLVYAVKVRVKNDGSLKIGMPGEVLFRK